MIYSDNGDLYLIDETQIDKYREWIEDNDLPPGVISVIFKLKKEKREKEIAWQKAYACFAYWRGPVDRAETYHEDYLDGLGSCDGCGRLKPRLEFIPAASSVGLDTLACEQCRERRHNYQWHDSYPVRTQNKGEIYTVALCVSVHSSLQQPDSLWCSYPRGDRYNRDNIFKP